MGVLSFNPHYIRLSVTQDGITDENGDYHGDILTWSGPYECDAVQSDGNADSLPFEDGKNSRYRYTIYNLPTHMPDLHVGDKVMFKYYGEEEKEMTVKGFKRLQLQCKAWL